MASSERQNDADEYVQWLHETHRCCLHGPDSDFCTGRPSADGLTTKEEPHPIPHPATIRTRKAFDIIDAAFTPGERKADWKSSESSRSRTRLTPRPQRRTRSSGYRCMAPANDNVRFSKRRIRSTCFAKLSNFAVHGSGDTDEIKQQGRQRVMKTKQKRDRKFADLPAPEDCEAASHGALADKAETWSSYDATKKKLWRPVPACPSLP